VIVGCAYGYPWKDLRHSPPFASSKSTIAGMVELGRGSSGVECANHTLGPAERCPTFFARGSSGPVTGTCSIVAYLE
jgi:hypothetical protein